MTVATISNAVLEELAQRYDLEILARFSAPARQEPPIATLDELARQAADELAPLFREISPSLPICRDRYPDWPKESS